MPLVAPPGAPLNIFLIFFIFPAELRIDSVRLEVLEVLTRCCKNYFLKSYRLSKRGATNERKGAPQMIIHVKAHTLFVSGWTRAVYMKIASCQQFCVSKMQLLIHENSHMSDTFLQLIFRGCTYDILLFTYLRQFSGALPLSWRLELYM